ncbi:hypothetical protein [Lentzea albidocapillata]|uniref:Uncharacterized protein n=1 Tax=Lentzea albidocapillata TaxID=40571 RepID=A0A1W2FR47_9PSEU|nr:hypothetical protein [Lentzea albidocapillata]SMD24192.1 hypothetical protein SAMN05660733_07665 [Lentzea albidocapillata]
MPNPPDRVPHINDKAESPGSHRATPSELHTKPESPMSESAAAHRTDREDSPLKFAELPDAPPKLLDRTLAWLLERGRDVQCRRWTKANPEKSAQVEQLVETVERLCDMTDAALDELLGLTVEAGREADVEDLARKVGHLADPETP